MDNQTLTFNKNHKGVYSTFRFPSGRGSVAISNSLFPGGNPPATIEVNGLAQFVPGEVTVKAGDEEKAAAQAAKAQEKADKAAAKAVAAKEKADARVAKAQAAAAAAVERAAKAAAAAQGTGNVAQPEL